MAALDGITSQLVSTSLADPIRGVAKDLGIVTDSKIEPSSSTGETTGPRTQEQASLSPTATLISNALKLEDVRTDKVSALQTAIAAGNYSVPADQVAGKVLESLLS